MPDTQLRRRGADSFAGRTRLESLTLRCGREERRRIEEALAREQVDRPRLSLSRFLAECVANGLPGNLPTAEGCDPEALSERIADRIGARMSAVEAAVPFIADVLADLAKRISALDDSVARCGTDAACVRELIEGAVSDDDGKGQKGDALGAAP